MDMGYLYFVLMGCFMKEIGLKINLMAKVNRHTLMEVLMKVTSSMERSMVTTVCIDGQITKCMLVPLEKATWRDMEF